VPLGTPRAGGFVPPHHDLHEPDERGKAFGIYGAIAGAGGALGLLLGGILTTYASWRWTLLVNLIFAAVAIAGALTFLRHDRGTDHDPLDWRGVLTATTGLFALVFGFSHAETTSWSNHYTIGSLIVAVVYSPSSRGSKRGQSSRCYLCEWCWTVTAVVLSSPCSLRDRACSACSCS